MQQDERICPRCSEPLDHLGRCRACWGDVFGLCHECGEILNEDGSCPEGCEPESEEVIEDLEETPVDPEHQKSNEEALKRAYGNAILAEYSFGTLSEEED